MYDSKHKNKGNQNTLMTSKVLGRLSHSSTAKEQFGTSIHIERKAFYFMYCNSPASRNVN